MSKETIISFKGANAYMGFLIFLYGFASLAFDVCNFLTSFVIWVWL